jgi:hypothetical protein
MAAIIFLPYLTFGVMDSVRKRCVMCMTIPVLVCAFFVGFMIFYLVQETQSFCPGCKYVQCVPYTANFCDVSLNPAIAVFLPLLARPLIFRALHEETSFASCLTRSTARPPTAERAGLGNR